ADGNGPAWMPEERLLGSERRWQETDHGGHDEEDVPRLAEEDLEAHLRCPGLRVDGGHGREGHGGRLAALFRRQGTYGSKEGEAVLARHRKVRDQHVRPQL